VGADIGVPFGKVSRRTGGSASRRFSCPPVRKFANPRLQGKVRLDFRGFSARLHTGLTAPGFSRSVLERPRGAAVQTESWCKDEWQTPTRAGNCTLDRSHCAQACSVLFALRGHQPPAGSVESAALRARSGSA